jgi:hypothetical protein
MKVTIRPTRAVVTVGNTDASVNIEVVELSESVDDKLCDWTTRTTEERKSFRRWVSNEAREVGEHWDVTDADGDTVASVVLV